MMAHFRDSGRVGVFRLSTAICVAASLCGCAGRAPQPVAVVQPQDRFSDCMSIEAEVQANNQKLQGLGSEEGAKVAQNVAAGVAGLFIWPLWFAMDFQGAAGTEETALQSRQQYLATLAGQRGCGASSPAARALSATAAAPPPPVPPQAPLSGPAGQSAARPDAGTPRRFEHAAVGVD